MTINTLCRSFEKHLPISGVTKDVGGMMSESSKKKTVKDSKTEMQSVTFSPQSAGK